MELIIALVIVTFLVWLLAEAIIKAPGRGRTSSKMPILDAEFEPVSDQTVSTALALPPKLELLQVQPLLLADPHKVVEAYQLQSLPPGSWPAPPKKWQA